MSQVLDMLASQLESNGDQEIAGLLRTLVYDDDPDEREAALSDIYEFYHHQGDVSDSTIAAVPFLVAASTDQDVPDREHIIDLLASIGGCHLEPTDLTNRQQGAAAAMQRGLRRAHEAALFDYAAIIELINDTNSRVRAAACVALRACWERSSNTIPVLRNAFGSEPDAEVRIEIAKSVGILTRYALDGHASDVDTDLVLDWFAQRAADSGDPAGRIMAMAQLARCAPERLPADVVTVVLASAEQVRPWNPALVRDFHDACGGRAMSPSDRAGLVAAMMRRGELDHRTTAIIDAGHLIQQWRGDYQDLVVALGEQLSHPDIRPDAAELLGRLGPLAAPAADALVAALDMVPAVIRSNDEWLPAQLRRSTANGVIKALVNLGDPRVVPVLGRLLDNDEAPDDLAHLISMMGPAAAELAPTIRERLRGKPVAEFVSWHRTLANIIGGFGEAPLDELKTILRQDPAKAVNVLDFLNDMGAEARPAAPMLRELMAHDDPAIVARVAGTLWRVDGDAESVLPWLRSELASQPLRWRMQAALTVIAEMGTQAAAVAPELQAQLSNPNSNEQWRAAWAWWRTTGDATGAMPALLDAWTQQLADRRTWIPAQIAEYFTQMGPAAQDAVLALRAEMAEIRRASDDELSAATDDEELLAACARAVQAMTAPRPPDG